MKRVLLSVLLFFLVSNQTFGQLKKEWGFWITDTAVTNWSYQNYVNDVLVDNEDNIYVQFTKDGKYTDTLFVRSYSSKGAFRWENKIYESDPNGRLHVIDADFRYDAKTGSIQSHYLRIDSVGFHLMVDYLNSDGGLIKKKDAMLLQSYEYNPKKSFVDESGNYIVANEISQDLAIAVIDVDGNRLEKSVLKESSHTITSHNYNMKDLNDEQFAIYFLTQERLLNEYMYHINVQVINKSDLTVYSSNSYSTRTDIRFPWYLETFNQNIYILGQEFMHYDKNCSLIRRVESVPSNVLCKIEDGFLMASRNKTYFQIEKMDFAGNHQWYSRQTDSTLQNSFGIKSIGEKIISNGNLLYQYYVDPFPDIFTRYSGVLTKRLEKSSGELLDEYVELFDTTRGEINSTKFAVGSRGSSINLTSFTFWGPRDSLGNLTNRTANYLYKVCDSCERIYPHERSDSNFINVLNNPSSNMLNYEFAIVTPNRLRFQIRDIAGRVLYQERYQTYKPGYYQRGLNLSSLGLSEGHYFLTLKTSYNKYTSRFVYNP